MGHIFISYSHKNKNYVHKLQEALHSKGFEVWIDDRIDYGDEWPLIIQDRLDECDAFILVATEDSYNSKWVRKEVTRAQRTNKPFFPLLLSGEPWLSIESTQYSDVTDGSLPTEKFYERLAKATTRGPKPTRPLPQPKSVNYTKPATIGGIAIGIIAIAVLLWGILKPLKTEATPSVVYEATATSIATLSASPTPNPIEIATSIPNEITQQSAVMLIVPAGQFKMGSDKPNAKEDEKPVHTVDLDTFYIDKFIVTNALYKMCVDAQDCTLPKYANSFLRASYYSDPAYINFPFIAADWQTARTYCEWRGARLPSEAEWEKAARGTDGRTYPWGEEIDANHANYNANNEVNYAGDTSKVDRYASGVSPYGAYDMAGNVFEWVADLYGEKYYASLLEGIKNPLGPTTGDYRVLRGGSWNSNGSALRSSARSWLNPTNATIYVGFRCARSSKE